MKESRLVEGSRHFYVRLIHFYPKEHVAEYGDAMVQVFTDQCREACQKQGFLGLSILWLRTIIDLGKTALDEHLQARDAKIGLPVISPLPWKDVWLVLIPSLVVSIIYAVIIIWGDIWSIYQVIEWLAYLSAVPILWIWWRTKIFPVWGLVPAGLILSFIYRSIISIPFLLKGFYTSSWLSTMGLLIVLIVFLGWRVVRQGRLSRAFYLWLGICIFATLIQLGVMLFYDLKVLHWNWSFLVGFETTINVYPSPWFAVKETVGLLLFIVCTTLIARKFGDLSVLFLLGYILTNNFYGALASQGIIYALAIAYRLLATFVLPIYVVRASSVRGRYQGIIVPIFFAILAQVVLESGVQTGWFFKGASAQYPTLLVAYSIFRAASIVAGFILAMVLCQAVWSPLAGSLDQAGIAQETARI